MNTTESSKWLDMARGALASAKRAKTEESRLFWANEARKLMLAAAASLID